jgi:hydroxyethylthiazole kinase-like sugar kinase family protein
VTHLAEEAADLSPALGALSLNLGTLTDEQVAGMLTAGKAPYCLFGLADAGGSGRLANLNCKPIIFDPVGCGATQLRKRVTKGQ